MLYAVAMKIKLLDSAYNEIYSKLNFISVMFFAHLVYLKCLRFSFLFTQKYKLQIKRINLNIAISAVHNISILQRLFFCLVPVGDPLKILHFYQVLAEKNKKQESYAKNFKIMLTSAYGKCQELRIVGRIAHFINSFKTVNRCFTVVIL